MGTHTHTLAEQNEEAIEQVNLIVKLYIYIYIYRDQAVIIV